MFLVEGHLITFHIRPRSAVHPRRKKSVNLIDAYTISGLFAARMLPSGQYKVNAPVAARRYRDGLECEDREEDTLFIVLYYPHSFGAGSDGTQAALPSLQASRAMLVFRARSRVERDLWCWAINTEIEKVARKQKERERAIRENGGVHEWK